MPWQAVGTTVIIRLSLSRPDYSIREIGMSAELAFMSAVDLARNIRQKKVSSLEATENFFERIDRLDFQLNSYPVSYTHLTLPTILLV